MIIEWREEKGCPPRVLLLHEGEPVRRISTRVVSLKELAALSLSSWEEVLQALSILEEKGGMRLALASLARRAYHSQQLLDVLKKHFLSVEIAQKIVDQCAEKGYLDDDLWTERRISFLRGRGKSAREIAFRLQKENVLSSDFGKDEDVLPQLIAKKYPTLLKKDLSQKEYAKIMRALFRRGFCAEDIQKFLHRKNLFSDMT